MFGMDATGSSAPRASRSEGPGQPAVAPSMGAPGSFSSLRASGASGAGRAERGRRMEAGYGWRAGAFSLPGGGVGIRISDGDRPASVQSVLHAFRIDPTFGSWFGACLAALPWRAFYWECPALNAA